MMYLKALSLYNVCAPVNSLVSQQDYKLLLPYTVCQALAQS